MIGSKRFLSHWQNILGLLIVSIFLFFALAAPLLAQPEDPENFSPFLTVKGVKSRIPLPPGEVAPLGTVPSGILGRQMDVYYTLIWGSRFALIFGLTVALSTALIGVLVGAASGFLGGWFGSLAMRVTDAFLAFPTVVAVVLFQQLLNITLRLIDMGIYEEAVTQPSLIQELLSQVDPVMFALVTFSWMPYARLMHTMVIGLRQAEFIQAARALGAGSGRIILRHLIPNAISPAIVLAARDIGGMVLVQATFTYIGLGGGSEWGEMLVISRQWIIAPGGNPLTYWWVFLPITLALILFGIGWNLLGDGLNDLLNPREK
ncbi:MAG: ABC transporter permease [Anaerolineales bacterium]|nr:ABC transporter permease [Anaerolineales bacterium]